MPRTPHFSSITISPVTLNKKIITLCMIEQFSTSQLLLYYIYHHSTVCEKYAIMYVTNSKILFSDERQMEDEVLKAYTLLSEQ